MRGYKIFATGRDGLPLFTLRYWHSSKVVPLDEWIEAEKKWRREGDGPYYWTGFHVLPDLKALQHIAKLLRRRMEDRVVVEINYNKFRQKPTNSVSVLADWIRVSGRAWARRQPLRNFLK